MITSIQPREEVFPGYHLVERVGSGGYAEVWRVRAPGGIDKAVKIVYGCFDEELALQEMKALERIKDVRHPFVLSLERFEIVDGRLMILTELAEMSLEQRAQQCRAQGMPGIPREELLRFMSDTAEALDYLADRHGLQHLDIKPVNLLISGDHVKVADFGLVKELAARTQNSMVAGMTPTYSSPEMFDDAPSPQSDQYSLAIVYQEMLTGVLPFPGRTTAQLANQHLRLQPQLTALGEADRPVVGRALEKSPADRFPSCRAFVKALGKTTEATAIRTRAANGLSESRGSFADGNRSTPVSSLLHEEESTKPPCSPACDSTEVHSTLVRSHAAFDTKSEISDTDIARPDETIVDVEVPQPGSTTSAAIPTLYVGVGGMGIRILCWLREILARRSNLSHPPTPVQMLAIDTDRNEIKNACSTNWSSPFQQTDALCLPLKLPQTYREQGNHLEWLSHRWLYNIPRSLETRGYRPLGRLAVVDHVDKVITLLDRKLAELAACRSAEANQSEPNEIRVVLVVGMGGGSGSGTVIDLANVCRSRIQTVGHRGQVDGLLVCTCLENINASPLSVANTYALLKELHYVSAFGNLGSHADLVNLQPMESHQRPFDLVYVAKALQSANHSVDEGLKSIASQMALAATDGACRILNGCRRTATPRELAAHDSLTLRTFGSALLVDPQRVRIDRLAKSLSHRIALEWLSQVNPSDWRRLDVVIENGNSLAGPSLNSNPAEIPQAVAVSTSSSIDDWRRVFGRHASTQFAYEAVSRVLRQPLRHDADESNLLSLTNPVRFIELASQAIASISDRFATPPKFADPLTDDDNLMLSNLPSTNHSVLMKLLDALEKHSADSPLETAKAVRIIETECITATQQLVGRGLAESPINSTTTAQTEALQALGTASVDLIQCGYDRCTMIFVPPTIRSDDTIKALTTARPTAAMVAADVDETVVFCECSGIRLSSLARGFERVYPGIADAASRLLTRIDLDWSTAKL